MKRKLKTYCKSRNLFCLNLYRETTRNPLFNFKWHINVSLSSLHSYVRKTGRSTKEHIILERLIPKTSQK